MTLACHMYRASIFNELIKNHINRQISLNITRRLSSERPSTNDDKTNTSETPQTVSQEPNQLTTTRPLIVEKIGKPVNDSVGFVRIREDHVAYPEDEEVELEPVNEPIKQKLIEKIPVEYHGIAAANFSNDTEWLRIFRLPKLSIFRALIRFKVYLTGLSVTACTYKISQILTGQCAIHTLWDLIGHTYLPVATIGGLIFIGDYFRRLVTQIYCSDDLKYVRLCRFTFFGNRRDMVLPVECIVPLTEINPSARAPIFNIRFNLPEKMDLENDEYEFYEQGLRLPLRFGGVIDRDKFAKVMGNVLVRRFGG